MKKDFDIDFEIYSKDFLNRAIADFKEFAKISIVNTKITINWNNNEEIDEIFLEFINYTTWLINE